MDDEDETPDYGITLCNECEGGVEYIGTTTHCEVCGVKVWE
jgi:hypothetical protein